MCGIAGIVSIKHKRTEGLAVDLGFFRDAVDRIERHGLHFCREASLDLPGCYLGGSDLIASLWAAVTSWKTDAPFFRIFSEKRLQEDLFKTAARLAGVISREDRALKEQMGRLPTAEMDILSGHLERAKDIAWCLSAEIEDNIKKIKDLFHRSTAPEEIVTIFKRINAVLNSIDRLEVRGRDSAGMSLLFTLDPAVYEAFIDTLDKANFLDRFHQRTAKDVLINGGISVHEGADESGAPRRAVAFTYKVAAEIGRLGDNVAFLRTQIKNDAVLQALVNFPHLSYTVSSHTRWASVGAISEPNCHPVDNITLRSNGNGPIFHVCLNGDIDNYLDLKTEFEKSGRLIPPDITTDTKIIPLRIQSYLEEGHAVAEAFRLAVNDFDGSHAISLHTDLAPGRLFLAQRGSGQAIFVGLADDHYMSASEVYGFIEETSRYLKLDGEKVIPGKNGDTQGQIYILDQFSEGDLAGIQAMYYDGTPVELGPANIKTTQITTRDIDRQSYSHYFLKEISESPGSVEKTLLNRWRIADGDGGHCEIVLDEKVIPQSIRDALTVNAIRKIFFVGQGTAGVAAQACADILAYYMDDPGLQIAALKASEMSGFRLREGGPGMEDTLVVAISQSGTTTDTNRTVDLVRERGAHTLAIVNRRDSDLTFKVGGVMYTSSGRDIEMSVASTKAFYSQIVAGALLNLYLARLKGRRGDDFVTREIEQLQALPGHMRKILAMRDRVEASARRHAVTRTYWAVVGSGPNKTSADEIRIKLSELCYKTISSDYVEDKKHIDLSSEPLIIICAAGTRETVLGDIIKDTAIFKAHKAIPIVIANEGETRFTPYAADVFHVPAVSEHLAPIINTLVGHIWGYYAALAINEGSRFLYDFRQDIQQRIDDAAKGGLDVYELILEKSFRERMAEFYAAFRKKRNENSISFTMGLNTASDLTLLLKYLAGRLPVTDFEMDFDLKGTARNMLETLFKCLGEAINIMARPIDAIKHQAKTVTVGTSRISEKIEGMLFDLLAASGFKISQLIPSNVIVMKNLQEVIDRALGLTLYRIDGLNLLGEPLDSTTITVIKREGTSMAIASRVDRDRRLRGSKRTIVQKGNVYIGKGRKDNRSILCIPLTSRESSSASRIEFLLLLHIAFRENIPLAAKVKALGGKYDHLKNIVLENNVEWRDSYLDMVDTPDLFGLSAEKVAETIVSRVA
ncbi:SIS domain-containing protein [Desulfococcus sp.]|uniref:SIS domain-containing protein n=1 Tax=Desulfococcus sp. TaxID=2025834 RepID=UPI0035937B24